MKFNILGFVIGIFVLFMGSQLLFKQVKLPKNDKLFVVGTVAAYAPWVSVNAEGDYEGFDIDVIKAVAKEMNKDLVLQDLGSMSALFMALDQGKIDAIIWGMSITKDRTDRIAMVRYQGDAVTSFPLLFWDKIPQNIKSLDDMKGMTVCVEPASSQDMVLSAYPAVNKLATEKVDDALLNVQYGKAVAALVEPAIAKKFKAKYPQIQILDVPLTPEQQVQGVGICIKKDNTALIEQVERAVRAQKEAIAEFEAKWNIA